MSLRLYLYYRKLGLRRAWHFAGMTKWVWDITKWLLLGFIIGLTVRYALWQIDQVKYNHYQSIESSFRAQLADKELLVSKLSKFFSACLGDREGAIWIGDQLHLCRAVPTGVRR